MELNKADRDREATSDAKGYEGVKSDTSRLRQVLVRGGSSFFIYMFRHLKRECDATDSEARTLPYGTL